MDGLTKIVPGDIVSQIMSFSKKAKQKLYIYQQKLPTDAHSPKYLYKCQYVYNIKFFCRYSLIILVGVFKYSVLCFSFLFSNFTEIQIQVLMLHLLSNSIDTYTRTHMHTRTHTHTYCSVYKAYCQKHIAGKLVIDSPLSFQLQVQANFF